MILQVADILKEEFELLKTDLIKRHNELGMKASGEWERSLEVTATSNKAVLTGLKYSEQLEFGRRAGKQPPSKAIEQWIKDKGIQSKISVTSLAFLIARKIAREGWKREKFGGVELISQVVTPQRIQSIIDKFSGSYIPIIEKEIKLMYQEA
jgi:hypothetical protein